MRDVMDSCRYRCIIIPTIKRRDLGGYEEITCQSCSCSDPKYPCVHQLLSHVLIFLLLQRGSGSLLITTKNTTEQSLFFLSMRILVLTLEGFWPVPNRCSWPLKGVLLSVFLAESIGSVQSSVVENPHHSYIPHKRREPEKCWKTNDRGIKWIIKMLWGRNIAKILFSH